MNIERGKLITIPTARRLHLCVSSNEREENKYSFETVK